MKVLSLLAFACVGGWIASCGGAKVDATSGATEKTGEDADSAETDNTQSLREPRRLRSIGDTAEDSDSLARQNPDPACVADGNLPEDVSPSSDPDTLHALGQERILAKDGPNAFAILSRAHRRAPDNAAIVGDLATAMLQCRMFDKAVSFAEKAAALASDDIDIMANLAQTYQIAGRLDRAVSAYRQAVEVDPKDAASHNNLAVLLILKDLDDAEKEARRAVNLAPQESIYLVNLGYILFRKKRLVDAEMILRRAIETEPESADAHNQLGLVLVSQKRERQAVELFRKALSLNPRHRAARENLGAMEEGFDFIGPWTKK